MRQGEPLRVLLGLGIPRKTPQGTTLRKVVGERLGGGVVRGQGGRASR